VARDPVPFIDEAWTELCDAVLAHGSTDLDRIAELARTRAQSSAWSIVAPLLAELRAADVVLIGTPMYNYSIPAALKAWLDQVTFPRMSLAPRRFVVTAARGGSYAAGNPKGRVRLSGALPSRLLCRSFRRDGHGLHHCGTGQRQK